MMQPRSELHLAMQRQAAKHREMNQALPRPARVRFSVTTKGVGETRLTGAKSIQFGALMLEEPSMTYGVVASQPLALGQLPLATAIVLAWRKNSNGVYVGCEMGFKIECAKSDVELRFDLTFEASTLRSTFSHSAQTSDPGRNSYQGDDPTDPIQVSSL